MATQSVVEELDGSVAADVSMAGGSARRLRLPTTQLRRKVVERSRLLSMLAEDRGCQVVRICAPAGFGKTILAAQLSERDPRSSCWLTLQDHDNDPVVLLTSLVYTLKRLGALAPGVTRERKAPARWLDVTLALLGEQLVCCDPFVLVLDDVGLVVHRDSLAVLSFLVEHVPPGSQVVLVSRTWADIALARLRAAGEVLDLSAADLAFDAPETRELLAANNVHLSDRQVDDVLERSEGWAAGIALTMLPAVGQAAAPEVSPAEIDSSPHIADYLLEEAVQPQSPEVRRFLLASSLLQRMNPALCDSALEITNSAQVLAALERDNLFLVPLGTTCRWYRYHRLFRERLEYELRREAPEVIGGVLSRAAGWHERRGETREALEYAHACRDLAHAGRILLRAGETLIARGEIDTARGWVAQFTPEDMGSDPQLALAGAWVALHSGGAAEASRLAEVAYTGGELDAPSPDGAISLRSSLANLRAALAVDGITQMRRDGESIVALERHTGTRGILDGWRAVATAQLLAGHPDQAIFDFAEILSLTKGRPDLDYVTIHSLGYSALAASDLGDWRRARKWAREAHALTAESGLQNVVQSVAPFTAHATVLVRDGLLPQARKTLQHVLQTLPMLHAMRWFEADISLRCADISLDLGDTEGALELADAARGALRHYPDPGGLRGRLAALDERLGSGGQLALTSSELRLIPMLGSHLSLQEIGDRVYLSRATIKTHTASIYRKLDVTSRSSAVSRLEALGLCRVSTGAPTS